MGQSNLSSLAYDLLLQSIISFDLQPGFPLQERKIAEQFEMSRTPVREALRQISHEGWIQNSRERNVLEVRPITKTYVNELFDLRELFELHGIDIIFRDRIMKSACDILTRRANNMHELYINGQKKYRIHII